MNDEMIYEMDHIYELRISFHPSFNDEMIYEVNHIYELRISFHPLFIPHGNIGTHK